MDMQKQLDKLSNRFDSFDTKLTRIDNYIDKEINYKEFKESQRKSYRQIIGVLGVLVTIIVTLTGWGFFEKGLYTPVPNKNNFTVTTQYANNKTSL